MIVLAIDTALGACQCALVRDGETSALRSEAMDRGHQERLAPLVAELFAQAGVSPAEVDRVVVTVGPGSFTGLRVGLAFAKGMALGLGRPLIGVGTLEALALGETGRVAAVIPAPHERCYLQAFDEGKPLTAPDLLGWADAAELCVELGVIRAVGPGAVVLHEHVPGLEVAPRIAADPARLAAHVAAAVAPFALAAPLYLREPDAKTIAERAALKAQALSLS